MMFTDLLDRCTRNETEAWNSLCNLITSAALYPIQRMIESRGMDHSLVEDLLQEFYVFLIERDWRPLRIFRGVNEKQFRCFLRTIAIRFVLRTLKNWDRNRHHERMALTESSSLGTGPTECELRTVLNELDTILSREDREKLQMVSDFSPSIRSTDEPRKDKSPVSQRTIRHWRSTLFLKYASQIV